VERLNDTKIPKCLTFQTNKIPELPFLPTQSNDFEIKMYVFGAVSTINFKELHVIGI
jgi:hypothetical protein